ncbi:MAG: energy transducer TonB [Bacteroidales bacterium]|nr:energy transducer TonB [Bacteroidales bacterium]
MKQYEGRLAGILGTIIIHLIGAILFMSVKLSAVYHENSAEFLVEFEEEKDFINEDIIEAPISLEELFENDDRFRDIVKNIANQDATNIDPDEYVDRVKDELIASGLLGKDNFIDEQKNLTSEMDPGDTAFESAEEEEDQVDKELSANEIAAMYQGPTRIYYDLKDRFHIKLPIPIYKCKGDGIVVLNIEVNQRGLITSAKLNMDESSATDLCLFEAAQKAAKRTRFNPDAGAPNKQAGSITYHFVAQ